MQVFEVSRFLKLSIAIFTKSLAWFSAVSALNSMCMAPGILAIDELVTKGKELIAAGVTNTQIKEAIGKHNEGNQNARSIKTVDICAKVIEEFSKLKPVGKEAK